MSYRLKGATLTSVSLIALTILCGLLIVLQGIWTGTRMVSRSVGDFTGDVEISETTSTYTIVFGSLHTGFETDVLAQNQNANDSAAKGLFIEWEDGSRPWWWGLKIFDGEAFVVGKLSTERGHMGFWSGTLKKTRIVLAPGRAIVANSIAFAVLFYALGRILLVFTQP